MVFLKNVFWASISALFGNHAVPFVWKRKAFDGLTNIEVAQSIFVPTNGSFFGWVQFLWEYILGFSIAFLVVACFYFVANRFFAIERKFPQILTWGAFVGAYLFLMTNYNMSGELSRFRESQLDAYGLLGALDSVTWFLLYFILLMIPMVIVPLLLGKSARALGGQVR